VNNCFLGGLLSSELDEPSEVCRHRQIVFWSFIQRLKPPVEGVNEAFCVTISTRRMKQPFAYLFSCCLVVLLQGPDSNAFLYSTTPVFTTAFSLRMRDSRNNDVIGTATAPLSRAGFLASVIAAAGAMPIVAFATSETPVRGEPSSITTEKKKESAREESISGFIAGGALTATKTIVKYPLDTATVRLQMPGSVYSIRDLATLFEGSYRGVAAPLVANIPAGAVFFAVKDAVKASLSTTVLSRWSKTCLAVAAAQFPYWLVRNPSEVVKTRQQAGLPGYTEEGVTAVDAYKKVRDDRITQTNATGPLAGLDAFFTGYWENILYAYPADVIKFVTYEQITQGRKSLAPAEGAVAGAISTAVAQLVSTPLDVVRNRVMAEKETDSEVGYWNSLVTIAKQEGLSGLFAGATPRVGKAILSGAIQFATYEETKQEIGKLFQQQRK
jgi:Mitochondrial carrier protein